eukprot:GDKH01026710.1.p1 GENE.GDKH01026710.1~~GDKH01026710.1.p1  ORF type:complete len:60 (+),score=0.13 GDKH01026710.1:81-260(+)
MVTWMSVFSTHDNKEKIFKLQKQSNKIRMTFVNQPLRELQSKIDKMALGPQPQAPIEST